MMNWNEFERSNSGLIEILSWHLPGRTKKHKIPVRIA
jgi:hypothetical protein